MTYRARNIVVAVALAVLAALLTGFYVTGYKSHVRHQEDHVGVLVATHDIPLGMSGSDAISHHFVSEQQVLQRSVVQGAFSHASDVSELVATQPIFKGEQVTSARFNPASQSGVRAELKGNMRAFQLPGDANQLLAGTLRAHDHVDLVANIKYKFVNFRASRNSSNSDDLVASRVVLRDIAVLRPPSTPDTQSRLQGPSADFSVLLAVTDNQAQKLFFVMKNGDWSLQLRPVVEAADSPESVETVGSVLGDGLHANQIDELVYGRRR